MTETSGMAIRGSPRSGTASTLLTVLFADVRGYTHFTVEHGDEAAAQLTSRFAEICEGVVRQHDGRVVELRGDEALVVFTSARNALRAAVSLQAAFRVAVDQDPSLPLRVGIGLDAGESVPVEGGYRGGALNLGARLCSLAGSGEVLASSAVTHLAGKLEGVDYTHRGQVQLKGFVEPVSVLEVVAVGGSTTREPAPRAHEEGRENRTQELPIGGFLGALPATALIGRDAEFGRILEAIEVVAGGAGRLVMLAGEPGAGKTRLAQEVTLAVRNRGFLVAAGSCFESRQAVPHYPFLDVLSTLYGLAPATLRAQVSKQWPYLGRLIPEAGIAISTPSADFDDQERLFWALTGFLQSVTEIAPVALFLDDLHWADGASLDLLGHLARHLRGHPLLLLGTYRDVEVGRQHPLERVLSDLHRQELLERIAVRRLGPEETSALVASTFGEDDVSEEFAALIYRHTEGNPFFTREVLRTLVERGDVCQRDGIWDRRGTQEIEVPESILAVIGHRLSRLSARTQSVLQAASVLGQRFSFDDLLGMASETEEDVELALEEALGADIIRAGERDVYAFNHALTQQALYGELAPRRKRRLHLAAGEVVEGLPVRRIHAIALTHLEKWDEAARRFEEHVLLAQRMPYPYAEARGLYYWGMMDSRRRQWASARKRLNQANSIFQRLGAAMDVEMAEHSLAELMVK